jgi:hypothetical protein
MGLLVCAEAIGLPFEPKRGFDVQLCELVAFRIRIVVAPPPAGVKLASLRFEARSGNVKQSLEFVGQRTRAR